MDFNSQEAFSSVDEQQETESCACTLLSQVNVARNNEVLLFQDSFHRLAAPLTVATLQLVVQHFCF